MRVFDFYSDPAHGWVKVPTGLLVSLGISDRITGYSYKRGEYAYLEEDADASTFIKAYKERYGDAPKFREHLSDEMSKIRGYESYRG